MSKSGFPVRLESLKASCLSGVLKFQNASNATQPRERTTAGLIYSFHWKAYSFHRKAAPRIAARKPPGIVNGAAPLDGADVACGIVAADWEELAELAELEDTLTLLALVDAELDAEDVALADAELADAELADAELAEEPEADEAEALPVSVATNPVWVPVAPWMLKLGEKL
jgi:hypothetical protein